MAATMQLGVSSAALHSVTGKLFDPRTRPYARCQQPFQAKQLLCCGLLSRTLHRSAWGLKFRNTRQIKPMGEYSQCCSTVSGCAQSSQDGDVTHSAPQFAGSKWLALWLSVSALLSVIAWLQNVFSGGLVDDTEPLFVEAARQMILTGDWITPQFNAQARFDKPALLYWLMAASAKMFGNNLWAYRLPTALAAMLLMSGLILTVFTFGVHPPRGTSSSGEELLQPNHRNAGLAAAASFALNLEVSVWGSTALSDMLLTCMVSGCVLAFFWAYAGKRKHKQWGYAGAAIFMGLAVLAKGPIGALLPVFVCFVFLLYTGELGQMARNEVPWLKGATIVLLVTLPWYLLMVRRHGAMFISTFFGYHNLERYTKGVNHHGGRPWWYAFAVVAVMYFPWSILLPSSIARVAPWRTRKNWLAAPREKRLLLFACFWLAVNFVVFWMSSSQLPSYYLPVAPAVALLVSSDVTSYEFQSPGSTVELAIFSVLYITLSVLLLNLPAILIASGDPQAGAIGAVLRVSGVHYVGGGVMLVAGVLLTSLAVRRCLLPGGSHGKLPTYLVHAVAMGVFFLGFFNPTYRMVDSVRQLPLRELCYVAHSSQEPLIMVGARMPSVVFYSRRPVAFFDSAKEAIDVFQHESDRRFTTALVFADTNAWRVDEGDVVARRGDYLLVRVQRSLPPES